MEQRLNHSRLSVSLRHHPSRSWEGAGERAVVLWEAALRAPGPGFGAEDWLLLWAVAVTGVFSREFSRSRFPGGCKGRDVRSVTATPLTQQGLNSIERGAWIFGPFEKAYISCQYFERLSENY